MPPSSRPRYPPRSTLAPLWSLYGHITESIESSTFSPVQTADPVDVSSTICRFVIAYSQRHQDLASIAADWAVQLAHKYDSAAPQIINVQHAKVTPQSSSAPSRTPTLPPTPSYAHSKLAAPPTIRSSFSALHMRVQLADASEAQRVTIELPLGFFSASQLGSAATAALGSVFPNGGFTVVPTTEAVSSDDVYRERGDNGLAVTPVGIVGPVGNPTSARQSADGQVLVWKDGRVWTRRGLNNPFAGNWYAPSGTTRFQIEIAAVSTEPWAV